MIKNKYLFLFYYYFPKRMSLPPIFFLFIIIYVLCSPWCCRNKRHLYFLSHTFFIQVSNTLVKQRTGINIHFESIVSVSFPLQYIFMQKKGMSLLYTVMKFLLKLMAIHGIKRIAEGSNFMTVYRFPIWRHVWSHFYIL